MIKFTRKWRSHKKGEEKSFNAELERRLVRIGKAEYINEPVKDLDIEHFDKLKEAGLDTPEQILAADLTRIKGIGKATEKRIKDELYNRE